MKEKLQKKQEELNVSLNTLMQKQSELSQQMNNVAEQITMHRGAIQYNNMLLKELEEAEAKAKEAEKKENKPELKAVEDTAK